MYVGFNKKEAPINVPGSRSLWCVGKVKGNVGTAPLQRLLAEYPGPRLLVLLLSLFETFHVQREIRESLKRLKN